MPSESQIQNCKKVVDEELYCFLQKHDAEKAYDEIKEKITPLVNLIFALGGVSQEVDEFYEKLENSPEIAAVCSKEMLAFLKDKIRDDDPNLTFEGNFRNGFRLGIETCSTGKRC